MIPSTQRTRRVAKRYQVNYQEHSTTDEEDVDMDDPAEKELVEDELAGYLDRMQTLHLGDEHQDSDQEQTENERRRRRNATDMRPTADIPPRIRELLNPSPLSFELPSHSLQTANPRPFSGGINRLIAPFATVRELNMAYYSLVELGMSKPGFKQFLKLVTDPCVIGAEPFSFQSLDHVIDMIKQNPYYQAFETTPVQVHPDCPPIWFVHRNLMSTIAHLFHLRKFLHVMQICPRRAYASGKRAYCDPAAAKEWEWTAYTCNCDSGDTDYPCIVFPIVFYSDKTSISKHQELWPIYVYFPGIDPDIVSKPDHRAMYLVGFIPIPTDQAFQNLSQSAKVCALPSPALALFC
ncbi:hypothetical protein BCR44DRAFT_57153 [Catenaria anguillulae PL171]|uniref:Uncharacterized protein n=1 Tax=Catenaria anguillulae PL171 TaxID=765915 RepID=A0A1Y2HSX0_9FUNG|nr:hypothetical protein BCR44DRAFT_57153 [Catenaria anguillulae PL171]